MKLGIHWGLVTRLANSASNCVVRSLIDTNTLLKSAHAVKSTLRAPKNRYRWFQLVFCAFNAIKHFGWSQKPATWSPLGNCVCVWGSYGLTRASVDWFRALLNWGMCRFCLYCFCCTCCCCCFLLFFCHFHVARELCVLQSLCKWNLQLSRVQRFCCCFKIETFIYKQSQSPAAFQSTHQKSPSTKVFHVNCVLLCPANPYPPSHVSRLFAYTFFLP